MFSQPVQGYTHTCAWCVGVGVRLCVLYFVSVHGDIIF